MTINQEKLAKLQAQARIGGKGTPRRKVKKTHKTTTGDDQKLQSAMKKLSGQPIGTIDEVNIFCEDGSIVHFDIPKVSMVPGANTMSVSGIPQKKDLSELLPGILSQLGPENLMQLKNLAEAGQASH
jgi:nascent polypeptide-associated complex subunit beta